MAGMGLIVQQNVSGTLAGGTITASGIVPGITLSGSNAEHEVRRSGISSLG